MKNLVFKIWVLFPKCLRKNGKKTFPPKKKLVFPFFLTGASSWGARSGGRQLCFGVLYGRRANLAQKIIIFKDLKETPPGGKFCPPPPHHGMPQKNKKLGAEKITVITNFFFWGGFFEIFPIINSYKPKKANRFFLGEDLKQATQKRYFSLSHFFFFAGSFVTWGEKKFLFIFWLFSLLFFIKAGRLHLI